MAVVDHLKRSKSSIPWLQHSDLNFGLIAFVMLATLAIVVTVMFSDATLPALEFPAGP